MPPAPERCLRAATLAVCALLCCAPARADIDIEVEGVSEEVRENVLIFVSLARYRDRDDLDADTVQSLHDRVEREARQALRPFGYYNPQISSKLLSRDGGRDWHVRIDINPGPPVVLQEVSVLIRGPGDQEAALRSIVEQSALHEGARLEHPAYEKLKGDLQRTAVSIGYLDVKVMRHELLVDPDELTAAVYLEMQTGPRYHFGKTSIEQDVIEPQLARRFVGFREGDPFDAVELLKTQFALDDSQYFSTVEIIPGSRDPATLTVPIAITAQAARRHQYSVGFGYGTDTLWRGTLTWQVRRVNRAGHRALVQLVGSSTKKELKGRYVIPVGDPAFEKLSLDATALRQELADLDTQSLEFRPGLTQVRGRWQRVLFAGFSNEVTKTLEERKEDTLIIPGISYALVPAGFSGDTLTLPRGLYAELTGSHSALGSDADYLRLRIRDERNFDMGERWHLLLRAELGTSLVADFSELPGSQRFFAGGDQSVRGFGLNELSPVDETTGEKIGGRHLLVGSVEVVRDLPRNLGVAVFFDAGNALNKLGDPLEYSVGLGLRWRLPIVTVGVDVAQAISRSDLSPRLHLNISPQL